MNSRQLTTPQILLVILLCLIGVAMILAAVR